MWLTWWKYCLSFIDIGSIFLEIKSSLDLSTWTSWTTPFLQPPLWDSEIANPTGVLSQVILFFLHVFINSNKCRLALAKWPSRSILPSWVSVWTNYLMNVPVGFILIFNAWSTAISRWFWYQFALSDWRIMSLMKGKWSEIVTSIASSNDSQKVHSNRI